MAGMMIKVKTEVLRGAAENVEVKIKGLQQATDEARRIVNASVSYWAGQGNDEHIRNFVGKSERMEEILKHFINHVSALREMAGIYEETEVANTDESSLLRSNVIM